MKRKIVVWGASGHALVVADIIKLTNEYEIVGFIDDVNPVPANTRFCGAPVLAGTDCLEELRHQGLSHIILGFGNCQARLRLAEWSREMGLSLATAIHPKAIVADGVTVGLGTVIAAGAVVNSGATIGENVIVNTCASVDHECVIEDGVHICPGVHLAGRVTVGRASWIGIGATVVDRVRIGAGSMIGAGAVVVNNIPDGVLAYGVPAKVIKRA
jgi:acetyltransferase EpsM